MGKKGDLSGSSAPAAKKQSRPAGARSKPTAKPTSVVTPARTASAKKATAVSAVEAADTAIAIAEPLRPRRTRKMSEIVAREILDDIHASNLVPGDRLPAESIMLRQYNIGRSTLREALRLLEVYGVLTIRSGPGGGPVLVEIRPRDIAQVMQLFLSVSGFTLGDVTDSLYFLQEMLARQAAAERDPTQLAALRKVVEAEPTDDRREFHRTISGFHHVMAELPRGRMLRVIVQAMEEMMTLQIGKQVDIHDAKENLRDHVDITDAIEAGDSDRAAELMAEHTTRVVRLLRKSAPGALDRRVEWT